LRPGRTQALVAARPSRALAAIAAIAAIAGIAGWGRKPIAG